MNWEDQLALTQEYKDKNYYYYSFKTQLEGRQGQGPNHELRELSWVNSSQRMDTNVIIIVLKPNLKVDLR
jgi:hypothetical protein